MARFITVYHPKLETTALVAEAGFYAKGGLRDRGWVVPAPAPEEEPPRPRSKAKPKAKPEQEE